MRNLERNIANPLPVETGLGWADRTLGDVTSLLIELARPLRGFSFYGENHPERQRLLDRTFRAISSELGRAGAIDLAVSASGFRVELFERSVLADPVLRDLQRALSDRGIVRLRIDDSLTRDALRAFFDLLSHPVPQRPDPERFVRILAARDIQGLRINDLDAESEPETRKLSSTPPRASASLLADTIATGVAPFDRNAHASDAGRRPALDEDPLHAPATDARGERLRARLIELDRIVDEADYRRQARDVCVWALDLWSQDLPDECYRALLVLADHAVGGGGRTEHQARVAAACFQQLADTERIQDLIDRATRTGSDDSGVRATQLLLQLGSAAVPVILDRIAEASDPIQLALLHALIVTLGEASLPVILETIEGPDEVRARIGIRLAGELQNPIVLPTLLRTLDTRDLARRLETIRALGFLPGESARNALARALSSELEAVAVAAAEALARAEGAAAVPTLLAVLEASLHANRTRLGRTIIEVLGRIGDERAVPKLSAILERKPVMRRAHWHAVQIATVDALAVLPTKEARRSIERAASQGTRAVRDRARTRLETLS